MIIGITGSIGSGKTTAAKIFSKCRFTRIDADKIGHEALNKNSAAYKIILKEFGKGILDKNKNIDRKKLGDIVFSDNRKLTKLNSIMHPAIIREIKNQIKKIKDLCGDEAKIAIDAPLLLETKVKNLVDRIIVIKSYKKEALKRLNKKYQTERIEKILNIQMPLDKKLKQADFVIDNNGDLKQLENQVMDIIRIIENKK